MGPAGGAHALTPQRRAGMAAASRPARRIHLSRHVAVALPSPSRGSGSQRRGPLLARGWPARTLALCLLLGTWGTLGGLSAAGKPVAVEVPSTTLPRQPAGDLENDDLASAIAIPGLPWFFAASTMDAGREPRERAPSCALEADKSLWFRLTPARTMSLEASTRGSDYDTVLSAWMGPSHPLREIACNDDSLPGLPESTLALAVRHDTTVFLKVEAVSGGGNLMLSLAPLFDREPPAHDDLADALPIGVLPYAHSADVRGATEESDQAGSVCAESSGASVWYRYVARDNNRLRFDTSGSGYDTVLAIWAGDRHPLSELACNDDVDRAVGDTSSALQLLARAGESYQVQVGVARGAAGTMNLRVAGLPPGPPGDDLAAPVALNIPAYLELDTTYATVEPGEMRAGCGTDAGHSVWFALPLTSGRRIRLETLGSDYPTILSLWQGSTLPLQPIACQASDGTTGSASLEAALAGGQAYRLKVEGQGDASGQLVLRATWVGSTLHFPLLPAGLLGPFE